MLTLYYLVSYFVELLAKGDTRMLEQIFQEESHSVCAHPFWIKLREKRSLFLTKRTVQKYILWLSYISSISFTFANLDEVSGKKGFLQIEAMQKDKKAAADDIKEKLNKKFCILGNIVVILIYDVEGYSL